MIESLRGALPKTAAETKALADQTSATLKDFAAIVDLIESGTDRERIAGTQIIKRWIDTGFSPEQAMASKWLALLGKDLPWECRLQVLQTLPKLPIPAQDRDAIWAELRNGINHENKFVRAWSYGGVAHIADQFAEHRREALALLALGMKDEPPAVKARIRNALKAAKTLPNSID